VDQGVEFGGRLHSRGSAPYYHEGQLRLRNLSPGQGRLLEALNNPVANGLRVRDSPHLEAVLLDPRYAEKGRLSA
jgi:hypothetical protein